MRGSVPHLKMPALFWKGLMRVKVSPKQTSRPGYSESQTCRCPNFPHRNVATGAKPYRHRVQRVHKKVPSRSISLTTRSTFAPIASNLPTINDLLGLLNTSPKNSVFAFHGSLLIHFVLFFHLLKKTSRDVELEIIRFGLSLAEFS